MLDELEDDIPVTIVAKQRPEDLDRLLEIQKRAQEKYREEMEEIDEIYSDLSPLKRKQQMLKDLEKMQKDQANGKAPAKGAQKRGPPVSEKVVKKGKQGGFKKNAFKQPEWDNGDLKELEEYVIPEQRELLKGEGRSIIDNDVIVLTKK